MVGDGADINLHDLEVFNRFRWLLAGAQLETLGVWVMKVLQDSEGKRGSSSGAGAVENKCKRGKQDANLQNCQDNIMKCFG